MGLSMAAVLAGGVALGAMVAAALLWRADRQRRALCHALTVARWDAEHDELTGLANRTAFYHRATRVLAGSPSGRRVAVALIDVDALKQVNDTLGHGAGDLVLCVVACRLQQAAGADGLVARLGGDEFTAVVTLVNGRAAHDFGRALHAACAAPVDLDHVVVQLSVSVGVVPAGRSDDLAVLLGRADHAMFRAKRGRLGIAVYDPALDEGATPIPASQPVVGACPVSMGNRAAPGQAVRPCAAAIAMPGRRATANCIDRYPPGMWLR